MKVALVTQVGGLIYLACWVIAVQYFYVAYVDREPDKAWIVRLWHWGEARKVERWNKTIHLFSGPTTDGPAPAPSDPA